MTTSNRLRALLPAVVLVTLVAIGLGADYYFASAQNSFVVTWSENPLKIKFSARSGTSGSSPDSFTCSPSVTRVTLNAQTSLRSEEHTSELQSQSNLVCRLLL